MSSGVGWSRSRRWLLETCPRRFVLTYPGSNGEGGPSIDPAPRLRLKRLIDGVRKDLFEDRSEGHAWSSRLHRVVLEQRLDAAGPALELAPWLDAGKRGMKFDASLCCFGIHG